MFSPGMQTILNGVDALIRVLLFLCLFKLFTITWQLVFG